MTESYKYTDRVVFHRGEQREFFSDLVKEKSISKMAEICKCSERTIRDWRREKFLMTFGALKVLCRATKHPFPQNIKVRSCYWYASKGGQKAAYVVLEKYGHIGGDPEYRKKKWREWWEQEGKLKQQHLLFSAKQIQKPSSSKELAEFVGIILGDGGISPFQVTVSLHKTDDRTYGKYVCNLIQFLFNVPVSVRPHSRRAVISYVVSRIELVKFCINDLGLVLGNKVRQQAAVPEWIQSNTTFCIACLRGLVDTDGSVFTHRYQVHGKEYSYKKLSFSNRSVPLLDFVFQTLVELGLHPRRTPIEVRLDRISDVQKYFLLVGTHNPKHLKRYKK